jgi:hypothetical protein
MLSSREADPRGAGAKRPASVVRVVRIGPHVELSVCVDPSKDGREVAVFVQRRRGLYERDRAFNHLARRAIQRHNIALRNGVQHANGVVWVVV